MDQPFRCEEMFLEDVRRTDLQQPAVDGLNIGLCRVDAD